MARGARITSIDSVQVMAAAVESFRRDAGNALEDLHMEIRRALEWIQNERREYWSLQVARGWERLAEARVQLQQAMTFRRIGNHDPSCIDEKKAIEKMKRRLEAAQTKSEAVRHWSHAVERAVNEYRGAKGPVTNWLDADFSRAMAVLKRLTAALDAYTAMETPADFQERLAFAFAQVEKSESASAEEQEDRGPPALAAGTLPDAADAPLPPEAAS